MLPGLSPKDSWRKVQVILRISVVDRTVTCKTCMKT